jgi:ribonuclease R
MHQVFNGDRILVRVDTMDNKGKGHAVIVDVLERNTETLVGRFFVEGGVAFVEVENTRIAQQVVVEAEHDGGAEIGQYVVLKITQQPSKRAHAMGQVIEVLGDHLAPGMEIEVAIRSYGIPFEWPADVADYVANLTPEVSEKDKENRIDIRHLPLVTIDGEDARDFDDAVYCQRESNGGWRLYVAIADVSHYVSPGAPLDIEANNRGTSVYFPDHVVPMLPEVLSNGLCSLKPKVDRLCMVCEMDVSPNGAVTHSRFYEGVMHSHARLTYNQVGTILDEPESSDGIQLLEDFADVLPDLYELYALYDVLKARRKERGAIDFETVETKIVFGEERKIEAIVPTERNDAHKIIEECMLCANVATAEFLAKQKVPALYRIHEGPGSQKLENVRSFLSELGLQLMGGETPTPGDYQSLMGDIKERPDFSVIQTVMLRSMSQAVYGPETEGHFGLAYDHYAHFTSPIRRYPDLIVHRAIKSVICSEKQCEQVKRPAGLDISRYKYSYDMAAMIALGEHCSMSERRADEATRDVMSWIKCEYLQQHLGEVFNGIISGVTAFGFFVELADLYVEGLVHVATLDSDYYQFDAQKHRLVGERTGTRYGLGDRVMVQVGKIDLDERKVDLALVSAEPRAKAARNLKRKEKAGAKKGKAGDKKRSGGNRRSEESRSKAQKAAKAKSRTNKDKGKPRKSKTGSKTETKKGPDPKAPIVPGAEPAKPRRRKVKPKE